MSEVGGSIPTISKDHIPSFCDLFALIGLWAGSIKDGDYRLSQSVQEAVAFTSYGQKKIEALSQLDSTLPKSGIFRAIFFERFHKELYIDPARTDLEILKREMSQDIRAGRIRYPWVFGNKLYRRANDLFSETHENLKPSEVGLLLEGTPTGVFQMRHFTVGPFGVLLSKQSRSLPAIRKLSLWHCSDPACVGVHQATLTQSADSQMSDVRKALGDINRNEHVVEWDILYQQHSEDANHFDAYCSRSLPYLLGNCFSAGELSLLLGKLLDVPKGLRNYCAEIGFEKRFEASTQKLLQQLSEAECFQLILLCKDVEIVSALEKLILAGAVNIPVGEIRSSRRKYGWFQVQAEAASAGIRFFSSMPGMASEKLKALITHLHDPASNSTDLGWRLKYVPGDSVEQKLDAYIESVGPDQVIREQVFASKESLDRAASALPGVFDLPSSEREQEALIQRMVWKLGFDVPAYPIEYGVFERAGDALKSVVQGDGQGRASDENSIRGAAANYFVSLERLLTDGLVFSTWALLSDHYAVTKFEYNRKTAIEMALATLKSPGELAGVLFDDHGRFTLFPLIAGYKLLANVCSSTLAEAEKFKRDLSGFPGYAGRTNLAPFPYVHTKLFLDISPTNRERIVSILLSMSADLNAASVAAIRNRIEHARDDFPSKSEFRAMLLIVDDCIDRLLKSGLLPCSYSVVQREQDSWGRFFSQFVNYKNDELRIPFRSDHATVSIGRDPKSAILLPCARLSNTQEIPKFSYKEESEYTELWQGIPIRKAKKLTPAVDEQS